MLKKSIILIFFIILISALSFVFFTQNESKLINKTENINFNNFEISNIEECRGEYEFKAICAIIRNNSNENYKFVQVRINLLDNNNNLVGNTTTSISNFGKGQNWKFSAVVADKNVSSFQIKDIIGIL